MINFFPLVKCLYWTIDIFMVCFLIQVTIWYCPASLFGKIVGVYRIYLSIYCIEIQSCQILKFQIYHCCFFFEPPPPFFFLPPSAMNYVGVLRNFDSVGWGCKIVRTQKCPCSFSSCHQLLEIALRCARGILAIFSWATMPFLICFGHISAVKIFEYDS